MSTREAVIAIVVAIIGGSGIPVWFLRRFDRKNDSQHKDNKEVLDRIREDVSEMKTDVSTVKSNLIKHLEHHLENDGTAGRDYVIDGNGRTETVQSRVSRSGTSRRGS